MIAGEVCVRSTRLPPFPVLGQNTIQSAENTIQSAETSKKKLEMFIGGLEKAAGQVDNDCMSSV